MNRALLTILALAVMGFGCSKTPDYVKAPEQGAIEVTPTAEGGKASTGGESATITPVLATDALVRALPVPLGNWTADEPVELKNPIPLPDGSRSEYTSVARTYHVAENGTSVAAKAVLTDTRGIPALTAFLDGYDERKDDSGYRTKIRIGDQDAWLVYQNGPSGAQDGSGSVVVLFNKRFLVQVDGELGLSTDLLIQLTNAFRWDELR
jgi:hypothetical protein